MLLLRCLRPTVANNIRSYAKKVGLVGVAQKKGSNMKQVHEETLRHINPMARINIKSDIYLKVRAADVHEYPDGDVLIAQLHGGPVKNTTATMKVIVSDDEKQVDIDIARKADDDNFHCEVEVPIRADLDIKCQNSVYLANIYDEELIVIAKNNINVKELRSSKMLLCSENGSVQSEGLLLSKDARIETKGDGSITLHKLQGEKLLCRSNKGTIQTDSCYVDCSKFETYTGSMHLKNVHKRTEVIVHRQGNIQMSGVNGNLFLHSGGGNLDLQLSQIEDENIIVAENAEKAVINIGDDIEKSSYIEINANGVQLDNSLSHLNNCLSPDKQTFQLSNEMDKQNKLIASIKGDVRFGKSSWADNMRTSLGFPSNKQ